MEDENEEVAALIFANGSVRILPGAYTLALFSGTEQIRRLINAQVRIEEAPDMENKKNGLPEKAS